ncbi:hypothetical protein AAF712_011772 [Marasmius tenuissimus]|uniref:Glucose-methanol-choline oxidoreductase N-terminal domain-containing protein n=1 Tax=Marasmius tenuissimus TaxID=585030 RepID=A0ABR2ZK87_9AGAR
MHGDAYFKPASTRPNLFVLPTAYARRIVTTEQENGEVAATGVEFSYGEDKSIHVANATREVVVSAGAIKSPQILELSGIGREDVLNRIGVPVKVPLPGVGENVQEHILLSAAYELKEGAKTETLDVLRDEKEVPRQIELLSNTPSSKGEGSYASGITNMAWIPFSDITSKADALYAQQGQRIREDAKNGVYPPGLMDQYEIQLQRFQDRAYLAEFCDIPGFFALDKPPLPGKKYFALFAFLNHPFSRGTIHASSNDPLIDPDMDPHYWEHEIDRQALVEGMKYVRKIAQTTALRDEIEVEYTPGPEVQTDEQIAEWATRGLCTTFHTAGSCSMLPRDKNGVVDTHLKVYGTKNIRVVDLSIVPLHISSHTQATVYTIAEIAADIIRGQFNP